MSTAHSARHAISHQTEAVAHRFLQVWNAGSESLVDELAAPDLIVSYPHFPEPLRGAEEFKRALRQTHEYFPDLKITAHEVVSTENTAVVRWSYRGTHQRGELFGVVAEGRPVEVVGISIYDIEGVVVHRERGVVDNLGLLSQLQAGA